MEHIGYGSLWFAIISYIYIYISQEDDTDVDGDK